jgi:hypothetical protein
VSVSVLGFLGYQLLLLHPLAAPLWLTGLWRLLFHDEGRRDRALGVAFLVAAAVLMALRARPYYLAPAYPMLLAAGGIACERWWAGRRAWLRPAYAGLLALGGILLAPTILPCLPPEAYIRYSEALGLKQPRVENHRIDRLPQLFADRFGWPEMAQAAAEVYHGLTPEEQVVTAIFAENYGEAGAIDLYGPALGLPKAISGHLNYWYWGPGDNTGEIVIGLGVDPSETRPLFESCEIKGRTSSQWSMPRERIAIYLCRGLKMPLTELWPEVKKWD